jgi:hypothetical protein
MKMDVISRLERDSSHSPPEETPEETRTLSTGLKKHGKTWQSLTF